MQWSPEYVNTFNELEAFTRSELHEYPQRNNNFIKTMGKSILNKKNLFIKDNFFWPNGLLAISLEWSHRNHGNKNTLKSLVRYYNKWIKKGLPLKNTDYTINGYSLIYIYTKTKNKKYLKAIDTLVDYLKIAKQTEEGSIPYRTNKPNHVLVDTLGMICPFLCRYGYTFNDSSSTDIAINQLNNFLKFGMDSNTNLPYHGYHAQEKTKLGIIGWGRALGWLLIGLIDSLEYIPKSNENYKVLSAKFNDIISSVTKYQLIDGNYTWQITAKDGHIDTSSTAMISYAIKRGVILGILPKTFSVYADNGLKAINDNTINGVVQNCSAECRGVGMYPQEYSSYPWAQGPATALYAISLK